MKEAWKKGHINRWLAANCFGDFDTRTVDLHVQRLRKKLGWQTRLASIHKVGYRLEGD